MRLPAKVEYACIAMVELARSYGTGEPLRIRKIGEDNGIPSKFLVQLLIQLKNAGLVASTRGAAGGYRLAKNPAAITVGDIQAAVDGHDELVPNASGDSPAVRVVLEAWRDLTDRYRALLDETTVADLAERAGQHSESIYYI